MSTGTEDSKPKLSSDQFAWLKKLGAIIGIPLHIATAQPYAAKGGSPSTEPVGISAQPTSRVVQGGSGYVFEQHADGKIFMIQSPKHGDKRIEVTDTKARDAIQKQIGAFPAASTNDEAQILGVADSETEKKFAEFTKAISNIVVTVDGKEVVVRPSYHINADSKKANRKSDAEAARKGNAKVNKIIKEEFSSKEQYGGKLGKATPEQMRKFLQRAIDEKLVDDTSAKGLRDFMAKYGISTDCSGLAVQALNYIRDSDLVRDATEEKEAVDNSGTGTLAGYTVVNKPSELQAGDLMVKSGDHVRLITDVDVEGSIIYFTTLESTASETVSSFGHGVGERRWRFNDGGQFKDLELFEGSEFVKAGDLDKKFVYRRRE
jgi:hypothetical protein